MKRKGVSDGEQNALFQYIECRDALDDIYQRLGCMCTKWSTDGELDHTQGIEVVEEAKASFCKSMVWSGAF